MTFLYILKWLLWWKEATNWWKWNVVFIQIVWYLKKTRNTHRNVIRHISTLLREYLKQSNHHTMHRKVKIVNMMFLFLITENQFKVVFKVKGDFEKFIAAELLLHCTWCYLAVRNSLCHTYPEMISPSSKKEKFSSPSLNSFPGD